LDDRFEVIGDKCYIIVSGIPHQVGEAIACPGKEISSIKGFSCTNKIMRLTSDSFTYDVSSIFSSQIIHFCLMSPLQHLLRWYDKIDIFSLEKMPFYYNLFFISGYDKNVSNARTIITTRSYRTLK